MTVNGTSAITGIETDTTDAPAEYYDLTGRRVTDPAPGIYVVRHGNSVAKEVVR